MAPRGGQQPLSNFLDSLGLPLDFCTRPDASGSDKVQAAIAWMHNERPQRQNYWPALVLALIAQAEELLAAEGVDSLTNVFESNRIEESSGTKTVNTLNFLPTNGQPITLRRLYNSAQQVIRNNMLRQHPSMPQTATAAWRSYRDLIVLIYQMSPSERRAFAEYIWQTGVLDREELVLATKRERVVRPFEFVLEHMPTTGIKRLPGGAMLQALTYGYFRADSPNLILESHSVNTGSARAGAIGDVNGYRGGEVELAAEVKDLVIEDAVAVSDFIEDIANAPNATAVVVCQDVTDEARLEIESHNITVLTVAELTRTVAVWDLPKQQEALRGVDYYLGRIQRSSVGQTYFRTWLHEHGLDAGFVWIEETAEDAAESVDG